MFGNDAGHFRPVFASCLTALAPGKDYESFLDWCVQRGFNGVRVFAGLLPWANQTLEDVYANLPRFLERTHIRGLYVEVTVLTETGRGYNVDEHCARVRDIISGFNHVTVEVANEYEHATQKLSRELLIGLGQRYFGNFSWAIGAPEEDEPTPAGAWNGKGGPYGTAHLDRGRDKWNQCRRVREIEACSAAGRFPVINNEPIGAAEPGTPGQRRTDADFFYCLGALNRLFEVGGVFHFEDGLRINFPIGPTQDQCAQAFVRASHVMDSIPERLTYFNVGHTGSPLAGATFNEGTNSPGVCRAYSGVSGNRGFTVLVGLVGDPGLKWANGWKPTGTADEFGGVRILSIIKE
jgi:hypothetical protein